VTREDPVVSLAITAGPAYGGHVEQGEPMHSIAAWCRSLMASARRRRVDRRARKLETAQRRAAEGYDEPPISMTNPGG
jgi:hypothetical protein